MSRTGKGNAETREAVLAAALNMSRNGLSPQKSGNVSGRSATGMLITPSGVPYEELAPGDLVEVALDGSVAPGQLLPSSEWHFHLAIYRARAEAGGVVHTHSDHATSLACLGLGIPAFHYMVAVAGGPDIRCAPYATFGTEELAVNVIEALEGRSACLMAHHGQVALGPTPAKALTLAFEVETLAGQYWRALQIGEPDILSDTEMARVLEKFQSYGKQPARGKTPG